MRSRAPHHSRTPRSAITLVLALAVAVGAAPLAGCGGSDEPSTGNVPEKPIAIRIGTLPTEDSLPLWVAELNAYFTEAGIPKVQIMTFQSAQERDVALTAGGIDAFMGDIIAAVRLEQGETPVTIATVMLGATPEQGRFGIVAPSGWSGPAGAEGLKLLAGVPVGTSSGTIQEYVLDGLMRQAGVSADEVKTEEVEKVPVRFELLMNGKLKAAALPEPFLSLAEMQGAELLADDTEGDNLSQTVLCVSDEFMRKAGGVETVDRLLEAWDEAVADVNAEPNVYRALLVERAGLPEALKNSYRVGTYPTHQLPTGEQVEAVLEWMRTKGLLTGDVSYTNLTLVEPEE